MSKINVLATAFGAPIRTKAALKQLLSTSPEVIKFLPVDKPTPLTERMRTFVVSPFAELPKGTVIIAHSPTARNWTAELTGHGVQFTVK